MYSEEKKVKKHFKETHCKSNAVYSSCQNGTFCSKKASLKTPHYTNALD